MFSDKTSCLNEQTDIHTAAATVISEFIPSEKRTVKKLWLRSPRVFLHAHLYANHLYRSSYTSYTYISMVYIVRILRLVYIYGIRSTDVPPRRIPLPADPSRNRSRYITLYTRVDLIIRRHRAREHPLIEFVCFCRRYTIYDLTSNDDIATTIVILSDRCSWRRRQCCTITARNRTPPLRFYQIILIIIGTHILLRCTPSTYTAASVTWRYSSPYSEDHISLCRDYTEDTTMNGWEQKPRTAGYEIVYC